MNMSTFDNVSTASSDRQDKVVANCELRLADDEVWVALVRPADVRKGRAERIGRAFDRAGAIAKALERNRLRYASAEDETSIAIAAYRRMPIKLMARGEEIHFLGLGR